LFILENLAGDLFFFFPVLSLPFSIPGQFGSGWIEVRRNCGHQQPRPVFDIPAPGELPDLQFGENRDLIDRSCVIAALATTNNAPAGVVVKMDSDTC
jgi:hypothetical protein